MGVRGRHSDQNSTNLTHLVPASSKTLETPSRKELTRMAFVGSVCGQLYGLPTPWSGRQDNGDVSGRLF